MAEWKDIQGYEGLYKVSNLGEVKSLERLEDNGRGSKRKRNERIISIDYHSADGHGRVNLHKNGVSKRYFIHRIVANCFLENDDMLPIINHKDENPYNNNVDNLEWCSWKHNANYGNRNKTISLKTRGENAKNSKVTEKDVLEIYKMFYEDKKTVKEITELKDVTRSIVNGIIRFTTWKHLDLKNKGGV